MTDPIIGSLMLGWETLFGYLTQHVVTCLVPVFFIAGAIASFVKKEAILKYFSPETKKTTSHGIASVSGAVLGVCSCTILPMFAGILKKGSGLGPAITFLYAGPAINVLAGITLHDPSTGKTVNLNVEGVFVESGHEPSTSFLEGFVTLNNKKEIIVDCDGNTSRDGIFAAGDVTSSRKKQIVIAVGDGAKAALAAYDYIVARGMKT